MKKAILIGWKDLRSAFRDRAALLLMLAAPFLLTLGMGLVTGRFSGGDSTGLQNIPLVIVNEDEGQLGRALVDVFSSEELNNLVAAETEADVEAARRRREADELAAVLLIPQGFTDSIIPRGPEDLNAAVVQLELYSNPARPISSGVVEAIVAQFLDQVETGLVGGQITVALLLERGLVTLEEVTTLGEELGLAAPTASLIGLTTPGMEDAEEVAANEVDLLAFLAPGMAVMFLMYTVSYGGRSLLVERDAGTLARLLSTPTRTTQVLGGKTVGIYFTGLAQLLILIGGTSLLFQLDWGNPPAVLALILATVFGACGWGILLAALARTPAQVSSVGIAMMLIFGILGGSFIAAAAFPAWAQRLRLLTPNAWALDGLAELALGGDIGDVLPSIAALLIMGSVLFAIAVLIFRRRGVLAT